MLFDTVVLDGDMEILLPLDGDVDLGIPERGESGVITVVHEGDDYEVLKNKPSINGVTLIGDKTTEDLGIQTGGEWGRITGTLSDQTDLHEELLTIPIAATVQEVEQILYLP